MIGYSKLVPTTKILGRQSWTVAGNPNLKAHFSVVFSYEVHTAYKQYEYIVITDWTLLENVNPPVSITHTQSMDAWGT